MSYTLRGRLESRIAALAVPFAVAFAVSVSIQEWWPVALAAAMLAVGLALDLAYHPFLPYQPGWAALPLGLLELGVVMAAVVGFDIRAPLPLALGLFGATWLLAQVLGHAVLPWLRLSYAEDGGELGPAGVALASAIALPFVAAGGIWYAHLPPTVHLAAGIHRGPLVIDRRERLVGEDGAVVTGGIRVRHSDVTVENVTVVGGEYGIEVDEVDHVVLDHVRVIGAKLDGIHVRRAAVKIEDCFVDMRGVRYGQGIDISFAIDKHESVVKGCRVIGGQEGIVTHSSMAMLTKNHVQDTSLRAIAMTEMSMGAVHRNTVRNANGVGILCGDHSMCSIERNDVADTRSATEDGDLTRAGFGILVQLGAEAELNDNELADNPRRLGVFFYSVVRWKR